MSNMNNSKHDGLNVINLMIRSMRVIEYRIGIFLPVQHYTTYMHIVISNQKEKHYALVFFPETPFSITLGTF